MCMTCEDICHRTGPRREEALPMKKGDPSAFASVLVQSPALSVLLMEVEKLLREKEQGLGKSC